MDDPITMAFLPLIGLPCWGVFKGQGSILSFEFGEPHLIVREPVVSTAFSPRVRAIMTRRRVRAAGAWNLFVFACHWKLLAHGETLANDEAAEKVMGAAVREVDSQKLKGVVLDPVERTTVFHFDLGAVLATWPYEAGEDELWSLYMPDEQVLSYRADGCYSLGSSSLRPDEEVWRPLPHAPRNYSVRSPLGP